MDWSFFANISLAGLASGGIYALIGVGFVIIYKATRAINFATGQMMMIASYFFFSFAAAEGLPVWLALLLAVVCGAVLGGLVERTMIRPLLSESPIAMLMVTIGLGSILSGLAQIIWTANPQVLPDFLPRGFITLGPLLLTSKLLYGFLIAAAVVIAYVLYFRFSRGGVALRATASDQAAAYAMGINVRRVYNVAWIFGALAASVGGVLVAASSGLSPQMGVSSLLIVLVVVILGGLDSIPGALIGGLFVGWVASVAGAYLGGNYSLVTTFSVLAVILVFRPYGLFGTHEIERL